MEFEEFHKDFIVDNQSRWNAVTNKVLLKPEIVLTYNYIDRCKEFISELKATIILQEQQIAQLSPSQSAERSLSIQISGSTGLTGYNKNLILEGRLFLFVCFFSHRSCTTPLK